jgi:hypothetical protein
MCRTEEHCGEDEYDEILIASREILMNSKKAMFILTLTHNQKEVK